MNKRELLSKVRALGSVSKSQRNSIVCSLIGHSRIHSSCFGYKYCARCEAQVGDSLGGSYDGKENVLVGHNCKTCRKNYKAMGWQDKLYVGDPFKAQS